MKTTDLVFPNPCAGDLLQKRGWTLRDAEKKIGVSRSSLHIRNCYFHDNEEGILAGDSPGSRILIEYSEFANNGATARRLRTRAERALFQRPVRHPPPAETRGGWKIRRQGPLFDQPTRTINATAFLDALRQILHDYCEGLKTTAWDSPEWENVRTRMNAISANCQT